MVGRFQDRVGRRFLSAAGEPHVGMLDVEQNAGKCQSIASEASAFDDINKNLLIYDRI